MASNSLILSGEKVMSFFDRDVADSLPPEERSQHDAAHASKANASVKLSRRSLLKIGALSAAGSGLLPTTAIAKDPADEYNEAGMAPRPAVTPFVVPLPVYKAKAPMMLFPAPGRAPVAGECGRDPHQFWVGHTPKKTYQLDVKEGSHSFHPELPTQKIWGYDGIVPGPTFVAKYGEPIVVRIRNNLPSSANHIGYGSPEISTHLHNLHGASESDGFPGDWYSKEKCGPTLVSPGGFKDHHYANCYADHDKYPATDGEPREALGTLWYHDHRMDFTAPNVYKGLAGFYLLFDTLDSGNENDPNPDALRLPSGVGQYDIPIVFQDKVFDAGGYLTFDQFNTDGILGNKVCVNGKIQPYFKVERRKYRFRFLNGSSSRFYEFYLTYNNTEQEFSYIANDGNLLEAPLAMKKVRLSPAERGDIVIDFSKYPIGTKLYVTNRLLQTDGRGPKELLQGDSGPKLLRFDVDLEPPVPDNSRVPAKLREQPEIKLDEVVRTRVWEFDRTNSMWTVNGEIFDVQKPAAIIKRGSAEIWEFRGKGGWWHPIHVHATEGRILSRNGQQPPPHERGRKDVYPLGEGEVIRVYLRFTDFLGKYIMHCHNTIHEDHAMMVRWDVVP
jgi:FtsP/CotA-like multicopper oxidase with cupredoxin domain